MIQLFPKKYSSRLMAITFIAGILPIAIFGIAITLITRDLPQRTNETIQKGLGDLQQQREQLLTDTLAKSVRQKSMDVALQIELYLELRPTLTLADLQKDPRFRSIALQPIEKNGYTTLIDTREGTTLFHPLKALENTSFAHIDEASDEFFAIISSSLGGKYASGYFSWREESGQTRRKFTFIAPVMRTTAEGLPMAVATVINMDELAPSFLETQKTSQGTALYFINRAQHLLSTFKRFILFCMLLGLPVVLALANWASAYFSRAVNQLKHATQQIRNGDFTIRLDNNASGDIGELMQDFNHMTKRLAETTVSKKRLESNEEELTRTNQVLTREIEEHERVREELQKQHEVLEKQRDHLHSVNEELSRSRKKIQRQNWLSIGQSEFHRRIQGDLSMEELGRQIIHFLSNYLDAQAGRIYLVDEGVLVCIGGFAGAAPDGEAPPIPLGEGLVGEAAVSGSRLRITDVPADYLPIHSGLLDAYPCEVVIQPCLHNEKSLCVVELAGLGPFSRQDLRFLDLMNKQIAVAVDSTQGRIRTEALLHQTRKQAEELELQQETLQQINQELEEQTQQLEEQKESIKKKNIELEEAGVLIRQKAKDLELSYSYKSQFLATISHELRTPLNSILLLSRMMEENAERNLTDDQVEFAGTIHSSGSQLLTLINEILDLSKIEAGGMTVTLSPTPLSALVESLRRMFHPLAEEKGLAFTLSLAPEVPDTVETDRQRLEQILKNLLTNALKFTDTGSVSLSITMPSPQELPSGASLPADSALAFRVTDTGIGIPKEKHAHVFEAFCQVDGTESKQYYGTGLGLTISRELSGLLGGSLHLSSEQGVGSCFTLLLPCTGATKASPVTPAAIPAQRPRTATAPAPFERSSAEAAAMQPKPGDKSLLIIEDDVTFASLLVKLAREKGFDTLVTEEGETGLHFADFFCPTAIILDITLPRMNGWDVFNRLKTNPVTAAIPVHVISSRDQKGKAMDMGVAGFHAKPVSLEHLHEVLSEIDATHRATASGSVTAQNEEHPAGDAGLEAMHRNLDEATLFLHGVESTLPGPMNQDRPLCHDKESILSGRKVLIVDDDMRNVFALKRLLHEKGMDVVVGRNGREGLTRLKETPDVDLVLMDIMMPEMDGYQAIRAIRKDAEHKELPIIALTAKAMAEDRTASIEAGANDYMPKPVDPDKLLSMLRVWLYV
ncbi:response regulator [Desulfoluna butyratoxydans]|uniref:histidine kinase n=1 Tax=Desulfoluna butyratoxydans TaxID=231438 RepID=A0A4U8YQA2_9BACT|nr:response regulator [Desulfoluna butyratoxydans]VFQ46000.1 signal transduction response regulator receiver domain [Desulfoluna butyratoxydans]